MLYPDPTTLQRLIDHHEEPLLAEADHRHLASGQAGWTSSGDSALPPGGAPTRPSMRHLLAALRHPGLQLHRTHP